MFSLGKEMYSPSYLKKKSNKTLLEFKDLQKTEKTDTERVTERYENKDGEIEVTKDEHEEKCLRV